MSIEIKLTLLPQRILVIRFSSLGDVTLALFLIRRLRVRFRRAHIAALTREEFSEILQAAPDLDEVIALPRKMAARRETYKRLHAGGFDAIIDLQNNFRSRQITALLRPRRLLRYHRARWNRWLRIHAPFLRSSLKTPMPVPEAYLQATTLLKPRDDGKGMGLKAPEAWVAGARERIHLFFGESTDRILVAAPGARHATKMMPVEQWIEFLNLAYETGFQRQALIGSASDRERNASIASGLKHSVLNAAGETTLGEAAGFLAIANVAVCSDSGLMHIAAGLDTPLVAIFGSTVPEFGFAPFRCQSRIIQVEGLDCRPCHKHGRKSCPKGHFRCMKEIAPSDILTAALEIAR